MVPLHDRLILISTPRPSCMNQKHLLRFIKKTLKNEGELPVCRAADKVNFSVDSKNESNL